jgi:hypothetical protein
VNLFRRWFWPRSVRKEGLALYKLGMACTDKQDPQGAMDAYTSVIELPDAPDDVKAMALYNRALLFAAEGKTQKASADLEAVMKMPIPPHGVKLAAKRRLERLQHRQDAAARPNRRSDP